MISRHGRLSVCSRGRPWCLRRTNRSPCSPRSLRPALRLPAAVPSLASASGRAAHTKQSANVCSRPAMLVLTSVMVSKLKRLQEPRYKNKRKPAGRDLVWQPCTAPHPPPRWRALHRHTRAAAISSADRATSSTAACACAGTRPLSAQTPCSHQWHGTTDALQSQVGSGGCYHLPEHGTKCRRHSQHRTAGEAGLVARGMGLLHRTSAAASGG